MEAKLIVVGVLALLASAYFISMDYTPENSTPEVPSSVYDAFTHFQSKYNKKYASSNEKNYRLQVYYDNFLLIVANNEDSTKTYTLGETQFMDLTKEEFVNTYLMKNLEQAPRQEEVTLPTENLQGSIDWRGSAVTRVKNQGSCGSCWAFSTVGALEGFSAIYRGSLTEYSEQQLVDCAGQDGAQCYGCNGGWPNQALGWVKNHGITYEGSYAYRGVTQSCQRNTGEFRISGVVNVPQTGDQLKAAVTKQPVSVCIDASNWGLYRGGVFNNCGTGINHAVLLVAYDDSQWIIKNSWDYSWGEQGYIRLAAGNTCGIYYYGTYPV